MLFQPEPRTLIQGKSVKGQQWRRNMGPYGDQTPDTPMSNLGLVAHWERKNPNPNSNCNPNSSPNLTIEHSTGK